MEDNKMYLKFVDQGCTVLIDGTVDEMVQLLFVTRFKYAIDGGLEFNSSPKTPEDLIKSLERCNEFEGGTAKYSSISKEEFNTLKDKKDHVVVLPMEIFR